jgi:hypothetical protein
MSNDGSFLYRFWRSAVRKKRFVQPPECLPFKVFTPHERDGSHPPEESGGRRQERRQRRVAVDGDGASERHERKGGGRSGSTEGKKECLTREVNLGGKRSELRNIPLRSPFLP